jgi:sugar O-acyltransferase (sialic acid O-acetyltransferase NeuD family)
MPSPIVVVGAGGFGRESLDILRVLNSGAKGPVYEVLGFVDDGATDANIARVKRAGSQVLGKIKTWSQSSPPVSFVLGVGSPTVRERLATVLESHGHVAATLIHPAAHLGSQVTVGQGSVICAGVSVATNVTLGRFVHLNANSTVGHDSEMQNFVSVNPGAVISGECSIGARAMVGAGAVVLQGLRVGSNSVVGASACVVTDVDPGVVVKGVPAR